MTQKTEMTPHHGATLLHAVNLAYNPNLKARARLELAQQKNWQQNLPPATPEVLAWFEAAQQWIDQPDDVQVPRFWLSIACEAYPCCLLDLKDPPLILFGQGNENLLSTRGVGMVGSRNASQIGLKVAKSFASVFAQAGWSIVSGLAEGIDGAAHEGALHGNGPTVAVLGGGLDQIYPKHHGGLARQILKQGGLLLSEYPPGTAPQPAFFPRRNRIIAALSDALLVVEAAVRSGSLITARVASELGRPVMAIPGSIHSPHSKGCHAMIKKGASLVETAQEVIEEALATLPPYKIAAQVFSAFGQTPEGFCNTGPGDTEGKLDEHLQFVLDTMGFEPVALDALAQQAHLNTEQALSALTELELYGSVVSEPGNRWVRTK